MNLRVNPNGSIVVLRDRCARALQRIGGRTGMRWGPENEAPELATGSRNSSRHGSQAGSPVGERVSLRPPAGLDVEQHFAIAARVVSVASTVTTTSVAASHTATITTAAYGTTVRLTACAVPWNGLFGVNPTETRRFIPAYWPEGLAPTPAGYSTVHLNFPQPSPISGAHGWTGEVPATSAPYSWGVTFDPPYDPASSHAR